MDRSPMAPALNDRTEPSPSLVVMPSGVHASRPPSPLSCPPCQPPKIQSVSSMSSRLQVLGRLLSLGLGPCPSLKPLPGCRGAWPPLLASQPAESSPHRLPAARVSVGGGWGQTLPATSELPSTVAAKVDQRVGTYCPWSMGLASLSPSGVHGESAAHSLLEHARYHTFVPPGFPG